MKAIVLLMAFGLLAAPMARAQYSLSTAQWLRPVEADGPYVEFDSVGIGDVNGDGRDDLVSVTASHHVYIFLQGTDGSLGSPIIVTASTSPNRWKSEVTLADLKGDGTNEIIVPAVDGLRIL